MPTVHPRPPRTSCAARGSTRRRSRRRWGSRTSLPGPSTNADLVYAWRKRMPRIEVARALRKLDGLPTLVPPLVAPGTDPLQIGHGPPVAFAPGLPSRPLRGRPAPRGGRDGRGLSCPRSPPRPRRRGQGPARGFDRRPRAPAALRAGGEGRGRPEPSEPARGLRRRSARGRAVRRLRVAGRADPTGVPRPKGPPTPESARLRHPDCARAGGGPREGGRPPRSEAGEPVSHPGWPYQDPRLRPGEAAAPARPGPHRRRDPDRVGAERGGQGPGDGRIHVTGTSPADAGGPWVRHLFVRLGPLRDAGGRACVQG